MHRGAHRKEEVDFDRQSSRNASPGQDVKDTAAERKRCLYSLEQSFPSFASKVAEDVAPEERYRDLTASRRKLRDELDLKTHENQSMIKQNKNMTKHFKTLQKEYAKSRQKLDKHNWKTTK